MHFELLQPLGWQPYFQQQLTLEEWERDRPARIVDYQRSLITADTGAERIALLIGEGPGFGRRCRRIGVTGDACHGD